MVNQVLIKIATKLKFLHRQVSKLNCHMRRMLCIALILPHFDYAFTTWYRLGIKTYKNKLKNAQNKCIRFFRRQHRSYIGKSKFKGINWLLVKQRAYQHFVVSAFKYSECITPGYMKEVFTMIFHGCQRNPYKDHM